MSYIDQTLGSSEKVLYRARIHSLFYARVWVLFIVLTGLLGWLKFGADSIGTRVALILFVLSVYFCLRLILPLWTLEIALTNLRIVMKRGLITRFTHELELKAIEEANLRQSLLGQILNYGTLVVRGIGDVDDLVFKNVSDPLSFRKAIASAMEGVSKHHGEPSITMPAARESVPQQSASSDRVLKSHAE
jgi:hypothetical protein